jgi:hypothetical protein
VKASGRYVGSGQGRPTSAGADKPSTRSLWRWSREVGRWRLWGWTTRWHQVQDTIAVEKRRAGKRPRKCTQSNFDTEAEMFNPKRLNREIVKSTLTGEAAMHAHYY